jgi:chromosome segregation ATPase
MKLDRLPLVLLLTLALPLLFGVAARGQEELDRGNLDMTLEELEQYTRELDLHLQLLKDRLRDADREIIELENEVMRQRGHIRDWQDYIDEELTSQRWDGTATSASRRPWNRTAPENRRR